MEPSVLDEIPPGAPVNIERVTFPTLAGRGELFGFDTDDYWAGTDRPDLLLQANLDRLAGRFDRDMEHPCSGGRGVHPTADIPDGADVTDTVIGAGVAVGAGSRLRRSVLLAGSSVGKDVVVEDSVVMGNVPDGAVLSGAVVGADAAIEPGQQVINERIPAP
jgi:NDP-sugar pyrophosphorylase family protein